MAGCAGVNLSICGAARYVRVSECVNRREAVVIKMIRGSSVEFIVNAVPVAGGPSAQLGESPLWDAEVGLRWLDVEGRRLFTLGLDGRETSVALHSTVTAVELGPGQGLIAVTRTGFGWLNPENGLIHQVLNVISDETMTMNDGAIDAYGRCWAGSAARDGNWRGVLYRLAGSTVTTQVEKLGMSNGIDWSPSGDVLYHVDSTAGTVKAWAYDLTFGELGAERVLRVVPESVGLPDGLTVDADGNIWVAIWGAGQVWRLDSRTGETTAIVKARAQRTTSCAFGGPDLSTLYITTAADGDSPGGGLLYAVDVPVRGRNPYRFVGKLR